MDIYTLLDWNTTRTYCKHRELGSVLRGSLDGRGFGKEWMDAYWCKAESLCCPPGTTITLLISYKVKSLSRVRLFATPWTIAHQAPPSMKLSRQEYWSGLPFPSPGDLPNPGIEPRSPPLQVDALPSEPYTPIQNKNLKKILHLGFLLFHC